MFNELTIIGRLGNDPEIRTIPNSDKRVATLSVCTNHSYRNANGQKIEENEWHSVVVFNGLVTVVESYLNKGDTVFIKGRLKTRNWEDQSGNKHYKTEVICNELRMIGSPTGQFQKQPSEAQQTGNQYISDAKQQLAQPQQQHQPVSQAAPQPAAQPENYANSNSRGYQAPPHSQHQQATGSNIATHNNGYVQAKSPIF